MARVCAPLIERNRQKARSLGLADLGCCGDAGHSYGFHLAATECDTDDYSIRRSGRPIANSSHCCAGDFGMNSAWARNWLAWLVTQVQAGKFPEIVEIIGSLDGKRALYWAKWNNWQVQNYTGSGHVAWAHVSCDRAKSFNLVDIFDGWPNNPARPAEASKSTRLLKLTNPYMRGEDVRQVQRILGVSADGIFGPITDRGIRAWQKAHHLVVDGIVGPNTRRSMGI